MSAEGKIVEAHCRFRTLGMSSSILRANHWRVQKDGSADRVAREAEHVEQWEVWRQALRGPPLDVEYDLATRHRSILPWGVYDGLLCTCG